jgi:hypothetical protein
LASKTGLEPGLCSFACLLVWFSLVSPCVPLVFLWFSCGFPLASPCFLLGCPLAFGLGGENQRKTKGKPKEHRRKSKGKPKENQRKTKGKPKENQTNRQPNSIYQVGNPVFAARLRKPPCQVFAARRKSKGKPKEYQRKTKGTLKEHQRNTKGTLKENRRKPKENQRKTKGKQQENQRKTKGNQRKTKGKPKERQRNSNGKPKENRRTTEGKAKDNQRKTQKGKLQRLGNPVFALKSPFHGQGRPPAQTFPTPLTTPTGSKDHPTRFLERKKKKRGQPG